MKKAIIIHGAYGSPEENWIPWLKKELEKSGYKVITPKFPTPEGQNLENWRSIFKENLDENTILIGHSIGCAFILDILENTNQKIDAVYLISAFISSLNNPEFDDINNTFYKEFNWGKIKENCPRFTQFHSDNDPYVPIEKAEEVKNKINSELIIIKNAGHFNEAAGYKKFEELKEKIIQNRLVG